MEECMEIIKQMRAIAESLEESLKERPAHGAIQKARSDQIKNRAYELRLFADKMDCAVAKIAARGLKYKAVLKEINTRISIMFEEEERISPSTGASSKKKMSEKERIRRFQEVCELSKGGLQMFK